ncbi:D-xylulose 5-phosphate/D-fructose 6-phosphate phosphoketolase-like protein [Halenospora varia]|nr:D-xylulose 5-phosphate/D-fructose 6-phosphate phosphoketolase-like protein [Halenospora varia]
MCNVGGAHIPQSNPSIKANHFKLSNHFFIRGSYLKRSDAGQVFTWIHFNRMIKKYDLDTLFVSGLGHGAPAVLSQAYLEGTYSKVYPDKAENEEGMRKFFNHATPQTPGSIYEGGELGYSISHAFGAIFDHLNLITLAVVGNGEAETGPLVTSWYSTSFLNPITGGAVLLVLYLNRYKINNPTILARVSHKELEALFVGYGWTPYFVEGSDLDSMHEAMAATVEHCIKEIKKIQKQARDSGMAFRPRWPMIILRSPKGTPRPPNRNAHMSANPVGNGGLLRKPLDMPDFRKYALPSIKPRISRLPSMSNMVKFLRDMIVKNPTNFCVFSPDETESNKLGEIYKASKKVWMGEYFEEDKDGGNLAFKGQVMEMLSEHTCEGWLEGYILSGRHGLLNSYESFIHIIDSMRQDHNGFTHQDPGFVDVVANKSPEVVRIYLPPDGNCLLSVTDHCLRSTNYVNVVHRGAIEHCTKGLGIWDWASNDQVADLDVIMASCGDVATHEPLAATALLREFLPHLKIRFVNVVDLFKLINAQDHPDGLSDRQWTAIFMNDRPIIFNFHSYPWLIHCLTYNRPGQLNLHVRGYKEKGNIDTPLELAIRNQTDRYSLAMDAIDRVPTLHNKGAGVREKLLNLQVAANNTAMRMMWEIIYEKLVS